MSHSKLAKKYQDRWTQEPGKSILATMQELIESGKDFSVFATQLPSLLQDLAYSEEVPDGKDLRGICLLGRVHNVDFRGFDFSYSQLALQFIDCDMRHARFDYAEISRRICSNLSHASFFKARMNRCYLQDSIATFCNFERATLTQSILYNVDFRHSSFLYAKCNGSAFGGARLQGCNFQHAKLERTALSGSYFDHTTDLRGASLKGAFFEEHRDIHDNLIAFGVDWKTALHDDSTIPP